MTRGPLLDLVAFVALVLVAQPAAAQRFALTIGNNFGDSDEEALRWAEDDAQRTRTLLTELGDVEEKNATVVLGADADGLRGALSALRQRVAQKKPGADRLLLAYYSGHGDADSLHLAGSRLPLRENHDRPHLVVTAGQEAHDQKYPRFPPMAALPGRNGHFYAAGLICGRSGVSGTLHRSDCGVSMQPC